MVVGRELFSVYLLFPASERKVCFSTFEARYLRATAMQHCGEPSPQRKDGRTCVTDSAVQASGLTSALRTGSIDLLIRDWSILAAHKKAHRRSQWATSSISHHGVSLMVQ